MIQVTRMVRGTIPGTSTVTTVSAGLLALALNACSYNINVSKNVGVGCTSTFAGASDADTQAGGSGTAGGAAGDVVVTLARSLQTTDDCAAAE